MAATTSGSKRARSGARCSVFVDDANSSLQQLYFCDEESTFNDFEATRRYVGSHGKPVAFYSGKASGVSQQSP